MSETRTLPVETVRAIAMVGRIVTMGDSQFKIHAVEGTDYYAFDDDGQITADLNMTPAQHITAPQAHIYPSTARHGDGFGQVVPLAKVRSGVCLAKSYR